MAGAVRAMSGSLRTTVGRVLDNGLVCLDARFLLEGGAAAQRSMSVRAAVHRLRGGDFTDTGNLVVRRWTPADAPGPLGTGFPADTFRSASYDEVLLVKETTLNLALKPEWNVTTVDGVSTTLPQATHYVQARTSSAARPSSRGRRRSSGAPA